MIKIILNNIYKCINFKKVYTYLIYPLKSIAGHEILVSLSCQYNSVDAAKAAIKIATPRHGLKFAPAGNMVMLCPCAEPEPKPTAGFYSLEPDPLQNSTPQLCFGG